MTKWTTALPVPGVRVHLAGVDTPVNPNRTPKWTPSVREVDTEVDNREVDTLHAHEVDTLACPCHESAGPGTARGWHARIGPLPVLNARHGLPVNAAPRWVDHAYRVRLDDDRWLYVAEPYELDGDALADLVALIAAGWDVSLTAWKARHYPGHTTAVAILAPEVSA